MREISAPAPESGGTSREMFELVYAELRRIAERCLRSDRRSAYEQWSLDEADALANEFRLGRATIESGETREGAARFRDGAGRHGRFE